MNLVELSKKFS